MKPTTIFLELVLVNGIIASAAGVKGLLSRSLFSNSTQCFWKEVAGTQSHVLICNTTYHASGTAANGTFPWASATDYLNIPSHSVSDAPETTVEYAEETDYETELEDNIDEDQGTCDGNESGEVEGDPQGKKGEDEEEEDDEEEDEKMEDATGSEYEELEDTDEEDSDDIQLTYINRTTSKYNWRITSTNTRSTSAYSHITSRPSNQFTLTYNFPIKSSRISNDYLFEDDGHFRIGFGRTTTRSTRFPSVTLVDDETTSYVTQPPIISTFTSHTSDIPKESPMIVGDEPTTSYVESTTTKNTFTTLEIPLNTFTSHSQYYYTTTRNYLFTWPKTASSHTTDGIISSFTGTSSIHVLFDRSISTSSLKMLTTSTSSSQTDRITKAISKNTDHYTMTSKTARVYTTTASSTINSSAHSIKQTIAKKYSTSALPSTPISASKTALNITKSFGGVIYNNRTINYFSASRGIEISWMLAPFLILFFIMSL